MISADGKCHTFDASANGYARGEGCGAVVVKRLSDALSDGDSIYAVLKGSAVMQDGHSASLTAPNGRMQEELIRATLREAGIEPAAVQYLEAHGTGTPLGDPIETAAIASVYGPDRAEDAPLYVSSAKANIGHLEAAAGVSGLMSAVLALSTPPRLPTLSCTPSTTRSPPPCKTRTCTSPAATPLQRQGEQPLRAAVSSFGYSGTIAHAVLEEAPASPDESPATSSPRPSLISSSSSSSSRSCATTARASTTACCSTSRVTTSPTRTSSHPTCTEDSCRNTYQTTCCTTRSSCPAPLCSRRPAPPRCSPSPVCKPAPPRCPWTPPCS